MTLAATLFYIPWSFVFTCADFPQLGQCVDASALLALQLLQNTAEQLLHAQYGMPPEPFF